MSLPEELRAPRPAGPRTVTGAVAIWFERHVQTLVGSLGRLVRRPFATLLSMLVIGVALALPGALHVVLRNAQALSAGLGDSVQLSLYLRRDTSPEQARKVQLAVEARSEVATTVLVSPEEGLREFAALAGIGEALQMLTANPLPWLVKVRPAPPHDSVDGVAALAANLRELPEAELVEADTAWVRRLHAIVDVLRRTALLAEVILALGVMAIVGNTIRLEIDARRAEIEVTRLVGGSDAFVRRPFLYSGFWQGLGGGLIALALLGSGLVALEAPVANLAAAYGSQFRLSGLASREVLAVAAAGAALGWLGAWLAAGYHLRRIEPF